jgi:hypothetical protein
LLAAIGLLGEARRVIATDDAREFRYRESSGTTVSVDVALESEFERRDHVVRLARAVFAPEPPDRLVVEHQVLTRTVEQPIEKPRSSDWARYHAPD